MDLLTRQYWPEDASCWVWSHRSLHLSIPWLGLRLRSRISPPVALLANLGFALYFAIRLKLS